MTRSFLFLLCDCLYQEHKRLVIMSKTQTQRPSQSTQAECIVKSDNDPAFSSLHLPLRPNKSHVSLAISHILYLIN